MRQLCYGQINCQLINRRNSSGNRFDFESGSSTFNECFALLCGRQETEPHNAGVPLALSATDGALLPAVQAPSLVATGHSHSSLDAEAYPTFSCLGNCTTFAAIFFGCQPNMRVSQIAGI